MTTRRAFLPRDSAAFGLRAGRRLVASSSAHCKVGAFAAQPQIAKRGFGDPWRQLEAIDQVGRGDHAIACLQAKLLDARCVLTVSQRKTIPFLIEPISPVTTGPQWARP
jgi:hypothetical protein